MAPHPTKAPERANRGGADQGTRKGPKRGVRTARTATRAGSGRAGRRGARHDPRDFQRPHKPRRAVPCCSGGSSARSPACHIKSITAPRPSRSHQTIHLLSPAFDFPPLLRAEPSRAARPYFNAAAAASACASRPAAGPSSVLRWRRSGEGPCRRGAGRGWRRWRPRGLGVDGGGARAGGGRRRPRTGHPPPRPRPPRPRPRSPPRSSRPRSRSGTYTSRPRSGTYPSWPAANDGVVRRRHPVQVGVDGPDHPAGGALGRRRHGAGRPRPGLHRRRAHGPVPGAVAVVAARRQLPLIRRRRPPRLLGRRRPARGRRVPEPRVAAGLRLRRRRRVPPGGVPRRRRGAGVRQLRLLRGGRGRVVAPLPEHRHVPPPPDPDSPALDLGHAGAANEEDGIPTDEAVP